MEGSKLGYRVWSIAVYLMAVSIKGASSLRLHRDLGITQKTAWYLQQRIREAWAAKDPVFTGPVEADETNVGGVEKNKHQHKRMKAAGGPVGKAIVAGVRDREAGQIAARVVSDTKASTLTGMVARHVLPGADVFTDEAKGYIPLTAMDYDHRAVKLSVSEYVDGMAHTNGIESFWALFKRGCLGTYHHVSKQHLPRYVNEFAGRHNQRPLDTAQQMSAIAKGMDRKRLTYRDLVAKGPHAVKRKTATV